MYPRYDGISPRHLQRNHTHTTIATMLAEEDYNHASRRRLLNQNTHDSNLHLPQIRIYMLHRTTNIRQVLSNRIGISIENISIKLPDKEVKTVRSEYTTIIGKRYFPGIKHNNKRSTTGTQI